MGARRSMPALLTVLLGLGACTDGSSVAVERAPDVPRNSDGSLQQLPPGPPSRPPHTLVMDYDDFGPPALAGTLLGPQWWQWERGGSWEPGDRFDIRVVVHRGLTPEQVAAEYPTVKGRADYRYVSYDAALRHFDEAIEEIEGTPELARLRADLSDVRAYLIRAMGSPS